MKKVFTLLFLVASIAMYAETYTIMFKSNGGTSDGSTKVTALNDIVESCTNDIIADVTEAQNIYNAKDGYGIKCGSSSDRGILTLKLDTTYYPTSFTIYACSYPKTGSTVKDYTRGIWVCGDEVRWNQEEDKIGIIEAYSLVCDPGCAIDSITFYPFNKNGNRYYVQKVVFESIDPMPDRAKISTTKKLDMGRYNYEGVAVTGQETLHIQASCVNASGLTLALEENDDNVFAISTTSLGAEGGDVTVSYNTTTPGVHKAYLVISGQGADGQTVEKEVELSVTIVGTTTHAGTQADPYTVTDAFFRASNLAEDEATTDTLYIQGVVTEDNITQAHGKNGLNLYITDGAFKMYVYNLHLADTALTMPADTIHNGDTLLIQATIQNYRGTLEISPAIVLQITRAEVPETALPEMDANEMIDPRQARIYTIQGMEVSGSYDRLPAGLYILEQNGKTKKILK